MQKIIIILIVLFSFISIGSWLYSTEDRTQTTEVRIQNAEDEIINVDEQKGGNNDIFSSKLENCEAYTDKYEHPFTGELMNREILGFSGDECAYSEEMPGGGEMNCLYSGDMRVAISQYYKTVLEGLSSEVSVEIGTEKNKISYTINGVTTENPLQEALISGECVIEGY